MTNNICCRNLYETAPSPFDIIELGWYDGITGGMARCRTCGRTFCFEMLAWDSEHEVRIYAFKAVTQSSYAAVAALDSLPPPSADELQKRGDELSLRMRDALATNPQWELYVSSTNIAQNVLAVRTISFTEWAAILSQP